MIIHIIKKNEWDIIKDNEYLTNDSLESDGYIHCSSLHNIEFVVKHFKTDSYVLLLINEDKLESEVRYEDDGNYGTKYPHVYGKININSIEDVVELKLNRAGEIMNSEIENLKVLNIVDYDDKYFADIVELFKNTVTNVNSIDYSIDEILAWINIDEDKWRRTLKSNICLVALYDDEVVGFGDISERGYLDRLYIKDKYINKNIGSQIVAKLEDKVKELNVTKVVTYASITSMNFFSAIGFDLVEMNLVRRGKEKLINYRMEKNL